MEQKANAISLRVAALYNMVAQIIRKVYKERSGEQALSRRFGPPYNPLYKYRKEPENGPFPRYFHDKRHARGLPRAEKPALRLLTAAYFCIRRRAEALRLFFGRRRFDNGSCNRENPR